MHCHFASASPASAVRASVGATLVRPGTARHLAAYNTYTVRTTRNGILRPPFRNMLTSVARRVALVFMQPRLTPPGNVWTIPVTT